MDFAHGGLNFQVEHHLFPRVPRHNLRIVSKLVKELCKKHNVIHRSVPFIEANIELITLLHETALLARRRKVDYSEVSQSGIYDAVNLIG